jgi:hypothetical protein
MNDDRTGPSTGGGEAIRYGGAVVDGGLLAGRSDGQSAGSATIATGGSYRMSSRGIVDVVTDGVTN